VESQGWEIQSDQQSPREQNSFVQWCEKQIFLQGMVSKNLKQRTIDTLANMILISCVGLQRSCI